MRTLDRQCFDKASIEKESRHHRTGNTFFEKSLYAFELLGRLAEEGLDFVFKGGTSLLLRLPTPRRLSIDVDIACRAPADRLERILKNCATAPFTGHEEDVRRHHRPPRRRHWNFAYASVNPQACPEPYVILDVLEEDCLYPDVELIEIRTPFFTADHSIRVRVPAIDNLLADKLTTFAPQTIGQEYNQDRPEKIAKHLFDIGELFNVAQSLHALGTAYHAVATAEIGYRGLASRPADCLEDTIAAARLVTGLAVNQELDRDKSRLLRQGIDQLRGHLLGVGFTARDAAVAAGKAAVLATVIRYGATTVPLARLRYDASKLDTVSNARLPSYPELAKLAQVSPEACYYWLQVQQLRSVG